MRKIRTKDIKDITCYDDVYIREIHGYLGCLMCNTYKTFTHISNLNKSNKFSKLIICRSVLVILN